MNLLEKLRGQGWYLSDEGLKKFTIIDNLETEDVNKVISLALDFDFKDIAAGALPSKLDSNGTIRGRIVLQIQKLRNVSAPKANEESAIAPRFLQLELSDGVNTVSALEFERIANLNLNIPPGTKLFIKSDKITFINGFAILKASDVEILGGKVDALVEKWDFARQMLKYAGNNRRVSGSGGPPPWIAFGKRLDVQKDTQSTDKHFKSLQIANDKDKNSKENEEFNASRTQAIAAASKAGQKKVFGGGQQNILDHNVKKIIEKGYTEEVAKQALKTNNNNLERTLYNLKRKHNIRPSASENTAKPATSSAVRMREKCGVSTKEEAVPAKPQANVSLFDFLTDKLPASVSDEVAVKSTNKEHVTKGEISLQNQSAKAIYCGNNKFENNMSSSFAANRANNITKPEESQIIQTQLHNFNRKQYENHSPLSNRAGKGGERNNSNRTKAQLPIDTKIQKEAPTHEEKLNVAGGYHNKRNDWSFKKEKNHRQPINEYLVNKRTKGNKTIERKNLPARDVGRNAQDVKNSIYQQKQDKKTINLENNLDNLVNSTSKLTIQNNRESSSNIQQNNSKKQQNNSLCCSNQQISEQFNKPEHCTNNYLQKSPKLTTDSQNISSKSFSHNTKLSVYGPQIGNGFAYDPSKIVGFQSKEANEYAINILKSQGVALQQIQQQLTASSQSQQTIQISRAPQHRQTQVPNQTSASVTFITPNTNVYIAQAQQASPQFGMLSGENWPWKEGDLCLAKYWDDGNFYDAKITAVSEKTCVVLFLGYGNHEEVLKSDCVPITDAQHLSLAPYQTSIAVPSISQSPQPKSNIHSGIGCGGSQRYRSERQMYVPPPKRTNN